MEATKITKIEFEKPIVIHEGESLVVEFINTPTKIECVCKLIQADGNIVIIGGDTDGH